MCGIGFILFNRINSSDNGFLSELSHSSSLNSIISSRGPSSSNRQLSFRLDNTSFSLHSSVLHMKGTIKQPFIYDKKNVVCYNGEIYGLEMKQKGLNYNFEDEIKVRIKNDTKLFSKTIIREMIIKLKGYRKKTNFDLGIKIEHMALVQALRKIRGEYSFIIYRKGEVYSEELNCKKFIAKKELNCIYFGRDNFGRRSLFITQLCKDSVKEGLIISSVSLNNKMTEIPPGRIYQLNIKTRSIRYINLVHTINYTLHRTLCENKFMKTSKMLYRLLHHSVKLRVTDIPQHAITKIRSQQLTTLHSNLAILFSGGLDSVLLSAFSHHYIPKKQTIDLLNISFSSTSDYNTPDRLSAKQSYQELFRLYKRNWRLIFINISSSDILDNKETIQYLIGPNKNKMDFNIATALYFLGRGIGTDSHKNITYSNAKAYLIGTGADEYTGGYKRHRNIYNKFSYNALKKELLLDQERLWKRNLGRDDRILSFHGRECRFPYLDEKIVRFIRDCKVKDLCDMKMKECVGDKRILRLIAKKMGFRYCVGLKKRAIQFGSRIKNITEVI